MDQLTNQAAAKQAQVEAQMTQQLARDEEARMKSEAQDPLVRLKQQEIDLKAAELQANLQKDMSIKSEELDIERDKLEAQTSIDLMKVAVDADKQKNADALNMLKENITTSREAMKQQSTEKIARENARSKGNGKTDNSN
jgi:hypothetical protein